MKRKYIKYRKAQFYCEQLKFVIIKLKKLLRNLYMPIYIQLCMHIRMHVCMCMCVYMYC